MFNALALAARAVTALWSLGTILTIAVGSSLLRGFIHGSMEGDPEYYILVASGVALAAAAVALVVVVQRVVDATGR